MNQEIFHHNYDWEIKHVIKFPLNQEIKAIPYTKIPNYTGYIVEFKPNNNKSWIGVFTGSGLGKKLLNGVYPTPNSEIVCIIAEGSGYFVNTNIPENYVLVPIIPVVEVKPCIEQELLFLVSFTKILAFDRKGICWVTDHVSKDGLRIIKISANKLYGYAYDPAIDSEVEFEVDLFSGSHVGGSYY